MSRKPHREEPNETTEMWRDGQRHRAEMLGQNTAGVQRLAGLGFRVEKLTDYQFRINGALDLYPTRRKYHHLPTGTRGCYENAEGVCRRFLKVWKCQR